MTFHCFVCLFFSNMNCTSQKILTPSFNTTNYLPLIIFNQDYPPSCTPQKLSTATVYYKVLSSISSSFREVELTRHLDRWTDGQMDERLNGWMDGQMDCDSYIQKKPLCLRAYYNKRRFQNSCHFVSGLTIWMYLGM